MISIILLAIATICIPLSFILMCREWRRGSSNLPAATARQIAEARKVSLADLSTLWNEQSDRWHTGHALDDKRWVPPASGEIDTPYDDPDRGKRDHGGN